MGVRRRRGGRRARLPGGSDRLLLPAASALLLAAGPASAAGDRVDVARGQELARSWCSECHQVEPDRLIGPYSDVPSFAAIARQTSTTEPAIRAFLATPHPNMPNLKLTQAQTDDIVDYILSLRQ